MQETRYMHLEREREAEGVNKRRRFTENPSGEYGIGCDKNSQKLRGCHQDKPRSFEIKRLEIKIQVGLKQKRNGLSCTY